MRLTTYRSVAVEFTEHEARELHKTLEGLPATALNRIFYRELGRSLEDLSS